ncbi:MAG: 3'(2'),5'-bisphosphate nucleotidase [Planctomycetes bacterium]|nr:3'(2'),5'-bisphosphate nucleotidase [Planctomycetota bacterium]
MRQSGVDAKVLECLISLTRRAGEAVLAVYDRPEGGGIQVKADETPLTEADLASHRCLVDGLEGLVPGVPVVSEEDASSLMHRKSTGRFWLIDPLDGTKEFIARNGEFTVNVALVQDGRPVLGLVHAPVLDELFVGSSEGARVHRGGGVHAISVRTPPSRPLRVVASKSHMNQETRDFIAALGSHTLVQAGSSLKFCRVAEGAADCYPRLGPTAEWDTAAAQAVVEGAGGCVTTLEGKPLSCGKADLINPAFVASSRPWRQLLGE